MTPSFYPASFSAGLFCGALECHSLVQACSSKAPQSAPLVIAPIDDFRCHGGVLARRTMREQRRATPHGKQPSVGVGHLRLSYIAGGVHMGRAYSGKEPNNRTMLRCFLS